MKKATLIFGLILGFVQINSFAQEEFKPSGSPHGKIFFNAHNDFTENNSAIQLKRAYLGYGYKMTENFSAKVTLDVGSPEVKVNDSTKAKTSFSQTAYLKTAALTYKKGKLKIETGMIGLKQYKIQEKHWGHRYIEKNSQDLAKMGTSADLGVSVSYKFSDIFSADLTLRNGEGYKKVQADNEYRTGLGLTLLPIEGITLRGFYDYQNNDDAMVTLAHFIGYKGNGFSGGVEYNYQINSRETKDQSLSAFSIFASYNFTEKYQLFGRFDNLSSNTLEGESGNWNGTMDDDGEYGSDGNLIIAGFQYSPIKKIQIALNYQGYMSAVDGVDAYNAAFLNFQIAF